MFERGSAARQAGLLLMVFAATLVLLVGGWAILGRAGSGPGRASAPLTASPVPNASSAASHAPAPSIPPAVGPDASDAPTITLTGAGDIADCSRDGSRRTSDLLVAQPGWFFTAGDNAYSDGSAVDYRRCYEPTWGRVLDRTILPAPGNHDWNTDGAAGYLGYFGSRAAPNGTTWYAMTIGTWHVIVLDSDCATVGGCDADSPQGRWLKQDLAASTAFCTLAIWHHPRFSSGEHGSDPTVGPFWDQLHAAGAELIVNGHDHDYERFAPQDPAGKEQRPGGIRQIVAGTGGAELRAFKTQIANSEFRQVGVWGVLRLTLHPVNYDWEFLPVGTAIADSGSAPCH